VTVAAPHGKRSELYTFVIAIGPSKASHHSVVAHALREIRKLQTPKLRYCGKTNTFIWTAFKLIVYLSDRPERSHLTFTGLLGTFSKRFQWAAYVDEETLPSCTACFMKRVNEVFGIFSSNVTTPICPVCSDWDYNNPDRPAWTKCTLEKVFASHDKQSRAYPDSAENCNDYSVPENRAITELTHVRPVRQTFDWLVVAIKVSFWHIALGRWFKYQFVSYLRTFGINEYVRENCYKSAKSLRVELNKLGSEAEKRTKLIEFLDAENLVNENVLPEIWLVGCELHRFVETPMHLLFSGITSDLVNFMFSMMTKASRKSKFEDEFSPIMSKASSLKLEWLKPGDLPAKQWASENYIAMARLLPFAFGFYCNRFDPYRGGVSYNQIVLFQRLINSFSMMIALLMRIDYVEEVVLERAIKLFLSCWSYCENSFGRSFTRNEINEEDDSTNSIFNKGNFLCEILRTIKISLGG